MLQNIANIILPQILGPNAQRYSFSVQTLLSGIKKKELAFWKTPPTVSRVLSQYESLINQLGEEYDLVDEKEPKFLEGFYLESARKHLGNYPDTEELSLAQNCLKEIPEEVFAMNELKKLDFSYNLLTELPDNIFGLTNLTKLDLRGNPLDQDPVRISGCEVLFDSIKKRKSPEESEPVKANKDASSLPVKNQGEPEEHLPKKRKGSIQTDHSER